MIDPERLARALALQVDPLPDGRRFVTGGHVGHVVDLDAPPGRVCDCPDHQARRVECKHALAARLGAVDRELLDALRDLLHRDSPTAVRA